MTLLKKTERFVGRHLEAIVASKFTQDEIRRLVVKS